MGIFSFFKRAFQAAVFTAAFIFAVGTGGIGGAGFIGAIKALSARAIFTYFGTTLILGEIANLLTPGIKARGVGINLPVFSSAARAQHLIGRKELTGLVNDMNEDNEDYLPVVFTVANHSCAVFEGVRMMGVYSEFNEDVSSIQKTTEARYLENQQLADRVKLYWNLTGEFDQAVHRAADIVTTKRGTGLSWVSLWIKRDKWFIEKNFRMDNVRFKLARTKEAINERGENPVDAFIYHAITYCGMQETQFDRASVDRARDICDTFAGGTKIRLNGLWQSGQEHTVLRQILDSMDGNLIQIGTKYHIFANPLSTDPPAAVVIEQDKLIDDVVVLPLPEWDDRYNRAQATYVNDEGETVSTPLYEFPAFLAEDGVPMTYDGGHFPFLETAEQVKRVITQRVYRFRYAQKLTVSVEEGEYDIRVWDKVRVNIPDVGLADDGSEYRIVGMMAGLDGRVDVLLQKEYRDGWYPALYTSDDVLTPEIHETGLDPRYQNPPKAPTNFICTDTTDSSISLSWDASDRATNYAIEVWRRPLSPVPHQSEDGLIYVFIRVVRGTSTIFENLNEDTEYTFRIFARNPARSRNYTELKCSTGESATAPTGKPELTINSVGIETFAVNFTTVEHAERYLLEQTDVATGELLATRVFKFSPARFTGEASTRYRVRIRGANGKGEGPWSDPLVVTTRARPTIPPIPIHIEARPGGTVGSVLAACRANDVDNGGVVTSAYSFQISGPGILRTQRVTASGRFASYTFTGLTPGATYRVRARAHNSVGPSAWTRWVSGVATRASAPEPPVVTPAEGPRIFNFGLRRISWTWDAPMPPPGGYAIEVQESTTGRRDTWKTIITDTLRGSTLSYNIGQRQGVRSGRFYRARLRSFNGLVFSDWTSYSNSAQAR